MVSRIFFFPGDNYNIINLLLLFLYNEYVDETDYCSRPDSIDKNVLLVLAKFSFKNPVGGGLIANTAETYLY